MNFNDFHVWDPPPKFPVDAFDLRPQGAHLHRWWLLWKEKRCPTSAHRNIQPNHRIWHLPDSSKFPKHIWTLNFPWKFLLALDPEIGSEMTEGTSKTEEPWVIKFRPSQFHTPQPWFCCSSVKFLKTPCTECFYKEGWLSSVLSFPKDSPVDASFWLLNLHPPHPLRWVPTSDKWSYHPKKWGCYPIYPCIFAIYKGYIYD